MPDHTKQNILLILTDQHRLSAVGCYGETPCRTPNIDRLASEGIRFETAYTVCPVCSPARATIMTGLYPHQHGICSNVHNLGSSVHELPDSPDLLSRRLQKAGYRCGYSGKWHLGTDSGEVFGARFHPSLPKDVGFEGQNFPGHGGGGFGYPEYKEYLAANGFVHEVRQAKGASYAAAVNGPPFGILAGKEESTVPYFLADHSIRLINLFCDQGDPFFIWHNFWGPHGPYYAPEEFYELYRNVEIPEWRNFRWDDADSNRPHQVKLHPDRERLTWDDWAEAVRHYYAFTTLIDRQIGRIMDHLRDAGLLDNTWVVFTADHGETIGSHGGLTDKGWHHFEEIQRIPMIVRPPDSWKGTRGTIREEWASLLDVYPTILDAAAAPPDADQTHGMSLLPAVNGEKREWRDTVFVEFNGVNSLATSMVTVRRGDLKYGWNCSSRDELYDLEDDPWEMKNVAEDPAYATRLHDMRVILADWMKETGYPGRGMFMQSRLEAGQ
jgi:arylsulfatase A-like enzyme